VVRVGSTTVDVPGAERLHTFRVAGSQFARLWVQVNTAAHQELVKAVSGRGGGAVKVVNGQVTIDLAPFINIVKQQLVSARRSRTSRSKPAARTRRLSPASTRPPSTAR